MKKYDPFRERKAEKLVGYPVNAFVSNLRNQTGRVGLEIEVEGSRIPRSEELSVYNLNHLWTYHTDGSLRGNENGEYVLYKPLPFEAVPAALDKLWTMFETHKTKLDDSHRTSVHVHLNVQDFHLNRLASLVSLYFIVEEVLTEWCGEDRVGNLFCLRAKDAPAIIQSCKDFFRTNGRVRPTDNFHYAALNMNAIQKFGSLEFRTLRGVTDNQTILDWVNILGRIYHLSAEYPDPREICAKFSSMAPIEFFREIFGPLSSTILNHIPMTETDVQASMYEGMRYAQEICYSVDWDAFEKSDLRADPFGRSLKSVMNRISSGTSGQTGPTPFSMDTFSIQATSNSVAPPPMAPIPIGQGLPVEWLTHHFDEDFPDPEEIWFDDADDDEE